MPPLHFPLVHNTYDGLGHRGFYSICHTPLNHFWWLSLNSNIKWYVNTCHQCQLHQTVQICILPTITSPAPLFYKVYIDTMFIPFALGFCYIIQAQCSLTIWPKWCTLCTETSCMLGTLIFKEILYRWGAVEQIVTDNSHIHISVYSITCKPIALLSSNTESFMTY